MESLLTGAKKVHITSERLAQIDPDDQFWCLTMRQLIRSLLLFSLLLGSGCGKTDPLNRQAVAGKITLNGEPLKSGTIEFTPVENGTSSGATIANGEYSVPQPKGLPVGEYIVRVSANDAAAQPIEIPGESNKIAKELIPNTYNTKSTVRFRVEDKKENVFDLNVETKK